MIIISLGSFFFFFDLGGGASVFRSSGLLENRISPPFFSEMLNPSPRLQLSQIPDPEKPVGDPPLTSRSY